MDSKNKTFALIICDDHDFYDFRFHDKKVMVETHEQAMGYFLDKYEEELLGLTLMTFCYEDEAKKYGYKFSTIKK